MTEDTTHGGYGAVGKALFFVIPAVLGAGIGLAVHFLLEWLLGLPWLPFRGPLKLLDSIPDQIALPVLMGLGPVAGVIFGVAGHGDRKFIGQGVPGRVDQAARGGPRPGRQALLAAGRRPGATAAVMACP